MSLDFNLDRTNPVALYQQIAEHLKARISDGRLPAGARLPTVRQLASDLGVTRLTVQNAYAELQMAGWVEATVVPVDSTTGDLAPVFAYCSATAVAKG